MDIKRAICYPFNNGFVDALIKSIVYFLCCMLVITAPAAVGYTMEAARRAAGGDETLPDWDNFMGLWVDGFRIGITSFVYLLPAIIIAFFSIGPIFLGASSNNNSEPVALAATLAILGFAGVVGLICGLFFNTAYLLMMRDRTGFGAGFNFSAVFSMTMANLKPILICLVCMVLINIVANAIGQMLFIGTILTAPLAAFITASLYAQLAQIVMGNQIG